MNNLSHDQFGPLFHGSTAETMKPGTIIRPKGKE